MSRSICVLLSTLLCLTVTHAEDQSDSHIQAVVKYFAKHGFKMEKAKDDNSWLVIDPKYDGWYINLYFKSFPATATEKEMNEHLKHINLAFMLNAPAKLAMSYPGLRGDAPGEPRFKAPDLKKLGHYDKLIKLFMDYRPTQDKK